MKVGVIGVGYWGKKHVAEYRNLGINDITAVDLSHYNLEFCRRNFGAATSNDINFIAENTGIEAVSICTPNDTHHSVCKKILLSGKNVLLEKPMTLSSGDASELIDISEKMGKILCVGHIYRHNNAVKFLKNMVDKKDLGNIYNVNIKWNNLENIWEDRDIVFDLAPHPLDIILYLFNKTPGKVSCHGGGFRQKNNEIAFINYRLGGVFVNIELSWITPLKERKMTVVGSEKTAFVDCLSQTIKVMDNSSRLSTDMSVVPNNTLKDELLYFLECVRKGVHPDMDGRVGREIVRIIELSNKSLEDNREISINSSAG
ncbi:MAG: Gfo/Idh/MocA family oxidoreductase [Candidatus Aenigmarchaeota archaeon]|nr:Gfo/Idh/MocA family oxidoreductase [Candidatus Aenigmarchaeota archaeon]